VRAKECANGVGSITDAEDAVRGFAAHSDPERRIEDSLYKFLQFQRDVLLSVAVVAGL